MGLSQGLRDVEGLFETDWFTGSILHMKTLRPEAKGREEIGQDQGAGGQHSRAMEEVSDPKFSARSTTPLFSR